MEAEAAGGHLVTIQSAEENSIVQKILIESGIHDKRVWIGGIYHQERSSWQWVDGQEFLYDNITEAEDDSDLDNNLKVVLRLNSDGQWVRDNGYRVGNPSWGRPYIIEFPTSEPTFEEWLNDGLVAYYPFDGDILDASWNGNDAIGEGIKYGVGYNGDFSSALLMDGSYGFKLPGSLAQHFPTQRQPLSVSFWLRNGSEGFVISQYGAHRTMYLSVGANGHVNIAGSGQGSVQSNTSEAPGSEWSHLVCVWDAETSNSCKIIRNGNLLSEGTFSFNADIGTQTPIWIGRIPGGAGSPIIFTGSIDNLRIYNRSLSSIDAKILFDHGRNEYTRQVSTAVAQVVEGFVVGSRIIFSGNQYIDPPEVRFIGGKPFEEAQAEAIIEGGKLVSINITNAGSGYQEVPTVRIESSPAPPKINIGISKIETIIPESELSYRAIATAKIINGFLVRAELDYGGFGYDRPPVVEIVDTSGTGALATATVEEGVVTSIKFVKAGSGYSEQAVIQIEAPPTNPDAIPRVTEVELSLQLKAQNNYYTIEASTDLANWEQIVEPFFAVENYHILKVRVQDGIRYFRAIQLP